MKVHYEKRISKIEKIIKFSKIKIKTKTKRERKNLSKSFFKTAKSLLKHKKNNKFEKMMKTMNKKMIFNESNTHQYQDLLKQLKKRKKKPKFK